MKTPLTAHSSLPDLYDLADADGRPVLSMTWMRPPLSGMASRHGVTLKVIRAINNHDALVAALRWALENVRDGSELDLDDQAAHAEARKILNQADPDHES